VLAFATLRASTYQHVSRLPIVHKRPSGKRPGLLHPIPPGKRPFQVIHVDHLVPFETSTSNNKYLLVIADNLMKYVQLYPCATTDAAGVICILKKFCDDRGIPDRIISDRGTCFISRAFYQFCLDREIAHTLNSTRHPQVKRANRTTIPLFSMSSA